MPGLAFLGAPVYWLSRGAVDSLAASLPPPRRTSIQLHLVVVFTVALPSAILGLLLLRFLGAWGGRGALAATIAYALGTLAFPWSTQFMAHQVSAVFLFGGAALILSRARGDGGTPGFLMAGGLFGIAVLIAETSVLFIPVFLVYAACLRGWRQAGLVCLGGLPFALLLLVYDTVAFGGPFLTAHHFPDPRFALPGSTRFLGQVGIPDPGVLLEITFLPYRGLFWYCPILIFGVVGLVLAARRKEVRPEAVAFLSCFLLLLLFNASFVGWHGGWSTGPRYLVPAIPFVAAGLLHLPRWARAPAVGVGLVSIFLMVAVTSVNVAVPQDVRNYAAIRAPGEEVVDVRDPIRNYILPRFFRGDLSAHRQHVDEILPGVKLSPEEARWASWNLGECLGLEGIPSLLPLLIPWGILGAVWARDRRRGARPGSRCPSG
jgi:hypothetical protein